MAVLLGALWMFPIRAWTLDALAWFETAGPLGWFGYGLVYLVVTLVFLPTSVLTVGGGFVFGPFTGFFVVWISENVAALACFVLGRFVARPYVAKMVESSPTLQALDRAMADRGFSLLVLLRHSPIMPFSVLNYSMALTKLSAPRYLLATLIGTALPALLYVYVGSTFTRLSEVVQGKSGSSPAEQAIYWGGLAATILATLVVGRATRRALDARLEEAGVER
ncbi:MAG: TVP38/TMEM64 family protein [Myxococcota bacterium]